ncbi:hypothetical protein [Streptomyces sp. NBRC 110611]|uniref:hypothetical protein n=1 Tax=Streptomyces sp. NBRC 110611 TaxID=1621259 RepID=UPI00215D56A6|nr:hypothetical protein [Streptomyces sp. NBRC 110611]
MGISVAAVALVAGVAGCQNGAEKDGGSDKAGAQAQSRTPAQAVTAAYKKTRAAKSAKFRMAMSMPGPAAAGGGDMKAEGVTGWNPSVMDMTVDMSKVAAASGGPQKMRMIMKDGAMYMEAGQMPGQDMEGKRWLKLDLKAAAEASGDEKAVQQMTRGLDDMNQDPAQQLALMLDSPSIKHVGAEKIDGKQNQHYKGKLTVDEALKSNKQADALSPEERKKLLERVKKAGVTGYDIDVWVNEDDYPSKMNIAMDGKQGLTKMQMDLYDYGAKAEVSTPAEDETVDLFKMLKEAAEKQKALAQG